MKKTLSLFIIIFLFIQTGFSAAIEITGEVNVVGECFIGDSLFAESDLWLDAADKDTIELVNSCVKTWRDKSGSGKNASQSVTTYRPLYDTSGALSVINFDGIDNYLNITCPLASAITLFIVTTKSVDGTNDVIIESDGDSGSPYLWSQFSSRAFEWYNTASERKTIKVSTDNSLHLITIIREDNGGILKCYFDRDLTVDSSSSSVNDLDGLNLRYIGSSGFIDFANINIGEIILFHKIITYEQILKIRNYLIGKWEI